MSHARGTSDFPRGVLREELFLGVVCSVEAQRCFINLSDAGASSGWHFEAQRYGRGEVGEMILVESQARLFLGRIVAVRLGERERTALGTGPATDRDLDALGEVLFLGALRMEDLRVEVGMPSYPRLGDRCFAAPRDLISRLPALAARVGADGAGVLSFARIGHDGPPLAVPPSRLFGRHCAIVGATGGGKSYTTARLIQEALGLEAKALLIDATGEYASIDDPKVRHIHLGEPVEPAAGSVQARLPPADFVESDFMALFQPSGKTQAPKLQEAIRSLRLERLVREKGGIDFKEEPYASYFREKGEIRRRNQPKKQLLELYTRFAREIEDPTQSFDVRKLVHQVSRECVYLDARASADRWGDLDEGALSHVAPLRTRIHAITTSGAFEPVFGADQSSPTVGAVLRDFFSGTDRVLRLCMGGVSYEYRARELMANAIARHLLRLARERSFERRPLLVFVDEAHNFMGRTIGDESAPHRLDAFELIAREGRKYGLILCLATQRPRDLTEGVLSQMGTMIVHRLTNAHDRDVVERASGDLDRRVAAFLPTLAPGEAVLVGADLPIPLTIHVQKPKWEPRSAGPQFGTAS